jgi:hypothetical protein
MVAIRNLTSLKQELRGRVAIPPMGEVDHARVYDSLEQALADTELRSKQAAGLLKLMAGPPPASAAGPAAPVLEVSPPPFDDDAEAARKAAEIAAAEDAAMQAAADAIAGSLTPPAPESADWTQWKVEDLYKLAQVVGLSGRSRIRENAEALRAALSEVAITEEQVVEAMTK